MTFTKFQNDVDNPLFRGKHLHRHGQIHCAKHNFDHDQLFQDASKLGDRVVLLDNGIEIPGSAKYRRGYDITTTSLTKSYTYDLDLTFVDTVSTFNGVEFYDATNVGTTTYTFEYDWIHAHTGWLWNSQVDIDPVESDEWILRCKAIFNQIGTVQWFDQDDNSMVVDYDYTVNHESHHYYGSYSLTNVLVSEYSDRVYRLDEVQNQSGTIVNINNSNSPLSDTEIVSALPKGGQPRKTFEIPTALSLTQESLNNDKYYSNPWFDFLIADGMSNTLSWQLFLGMQDDMDSVYETLNVDYYLTSPQ